MKLVIVESPAKCTTIQKYLGDEYLVKASLGHIRDLATSGKGGLGVDVDNAFAPTYTINKDKTKTVQELIALARKADEVILATDPDREGEAIAWHLAEVLHLDIPTNKRLEFHEITRDTITEAIKTPRTIDMNLVSSQETRRILDRIIGFKLSTLMNSKIHSKSAGRVQSATLKLICDHDKEISEFVSEEYWNILAKTSIGTKTFDLNFVGLNGKKQDINNKEEADKVLAGLPDKLIVKNVEKSIRTSESKDPFTTSTMQQEAFNKLKFKTKKTQFIAQSLYEGISIDGEHVGLITYMRTDSTRLSPVFINRATAYIKETFGEDYLGHSKQIQKVGHMQDAHEAIRPTSNHRTPESVRKYLTPDQYNLYTLIYNRTLASLMKPKKEEVTKVTFNGNDYTFTLEFDRTVFKGYEIILKEDNSYHGEIPEVNQGDEFPLIEKRSEQKFTQPPAHYSEAKLVKLMEEVGIGRPSTYSSTIETLKSRGYVDNVNGVMTATEQGIKTAIVLNKYFPEIVNVKYTAAMENKLDLVQEGSNSRLDMLTNFYVPFMKELELAKEKIYKDDQIETGEVCPICGSPLIYKKGKNGDFIGCSNYPKCKYVKKEPKKEVIYTGETCPKCGKPLCERTDKKGNKFIACSGYPNCNYIVQENNEVTPDQYVKKCPECDGYLVKKKGKFGYFLGCTNYPTCKHMEKIRGAKGKRN